MTLFAVNEASAWTLETISHTSGTVNEIRTLAWVTIGMLGVITVLLTVMLMVKRATALRLDSTEEMLHDVWHVLTLLKGYEQLGHVQQQETKQAATETRATMGAVLETMKNTASEIKNAATTVAAAAGSSPPSSSSDVTPFQ